MNKPIKIIVFDFDGTLADTNSLKKDAYYKIFSQTDVYHKAIGDVLKDHIEETRTSIITRIIDKAESANLSADERNVLIQDTVAEYGRIVSEGVLNAEDMPGAVDVLNSVSNHYTLYVSSTTPHDSINQIIEARDWTHYFKEVSGYPNLKPNVLKSICEKENVTPDEVIVVGDGNSDRNAAESINCRLYMIPEDGNLLDLLNLPDILTNENPTQDSI